MEEWKEWEEFRGIPISAQLAEWEGHSPIYTELSRETNGWSGLDNR